MTNIKIKLKEQGPSDESILARKNFPEVVKEYRFIKSSYAKVASLWGATIGMTVFLAFAATETIGTKTGDNSNLSKKQIKITPPFETATKQTVEIENSDEEHANIESSSKNEVSAMTSPEKKPVEATEITREKTDPVVKETQPNELIKTKKMNVNYIPE